MSNQFDIDKITNYLEPYKPNLATLYKWKVSIEKLIALQILSETQTATINCLSSYEKELRLKQIVGNKLNDTFHSDPDLFDKLCLWVIKEWGGITSNNDKKTIRLVRDYLTQEKPSFNRIASTSKVGSFMFPDRNVIYDSRVAYSLNWIILSESAGQYFFPIPEGRNSKMSAFDLNVLIRLKNISAYQVSDISHLDHRLFIQQSDKKLFLDKKVAYFELNKLVKQISQLLWKGDLEKQEKLFYTEMLLFSIADREILMDIISKHLDNKTQ